MQSKEQIKEIILNSKVWAAQEARKILKRVEASKKSSIILETGYGPSGLPHIGTFGEVSRTSTVMFALKQLTDIPVKLIAFSDDLDGLRKVPGNVPNQELLAKYIDFPLTRVPDPFERYNSFGEHNNNKLKEFLDKFGFDYEFYSATKCYTSGMFDSYLIKILELHEEICNVVRPTLGEERRATYSPFLPIDKASGKVLQAKVIATDPAKGTITYLGEEGQEVTTSVTGGNVKLQWKVDWAMRWCALGVDYEMYGKDLIPSFELSEKIAKLLGHKPPINYVYEHFLDEQGQKISKSKGNGLTIEEWLTYGSPESLSTFMFQKPQTAKRLYFDVIPRYVDEWLRYVVSYNTEPESSKRYDNPVFYITAGSTPKLTDYISFNLILNLVSVIPTASKEQIWHFLDQYKQLSDFNREYTNSLLDYAINYAKDFIIPQLKYRILTPEDRPRFLKLKELIATKGEKLSADELQSAIYRIGIEDSLSLKDWFSSIYSALLGSSEGPRVGNFFKLIGIDKALSLIEESLNRKIKR